MIGKLPFEKFFAEYVERPSEAYRQTIGPPVHLDAEAFELFVAQLRDYRALYSNISFWQIIDHKTYHITHKDGDLETFGWPFTTFKDFFRTMHPDYLLPYLRWRTAAFELIFSKAINADPLNVAYRFGIPLQVKGGDYYWFTMNSTVVQVDGNGQIVTSLQTFYQENKWSTRNLRPVEASLRLRSKNHQDLEKQIIARLSLQLADEFTDGELDLTALYAAGKTTKEILDAKNWSRHTLHEYNANLLRKAKDLFVYDFRSARSFAEYCAEKDYFKFPKPPM